MSLSWLLFSSIPLELIIYNFYFFQILFQGRSPTKISLSAADIFTITGNIVAVSRQLSLAGWLELLENAGNSGNLFQRGLTVPTFRPSRCGIPRYFASVVCACRSCVYLSFGLIRIVSYRSEAAAEAFSASSPFGDSGNSYVHARLG